MPYDWERFEEGATATATAINGELSDVAAEINDLQELSVQPRSLHDAHIPSIVDLSQRTAVGTDAFEHHNLFVGYADSTYSGGRSPGTTGWYVVTEGPASSPGNELQITHDALDLGEAGDTTRLRSYFAMANIQASKIYVTGLDDNTGGLEDGDVRVDYYGVFQFQLYLSTDAAGATKTWFNIKRSQRYVNSETPSGEHGDGAGGSDSGLYNMACFKDVPLRLMVNSQEVRDWGYRYIWGARVVCAVWDNDRGSNPRLRMQRCNLSVFSLQAPKSN